MPEDFIAHSKAILATEPVLPVEGNRASSKAILATEPVLPVEGNRGIETGFM